MRLNGKGEGRRDRIKEKGKAGQTDGWIEEGRGRKEWRKRKRVRERVRERERERERARH